jgi:hypothetical protein
VPCSIHRKSAAWGSAGSGVTKSMPVRSRWYVVIREAVFAVRRSAFRACASGDSSHPSGSNAEAAEIDVRSIDIGEVCSARVLISCTWKGWRSRSSARKAASPSSSVKVGSCR